MFVESEMRLLHCILLNHMCLMPVGLVVAVVGFAVAVARRKTKFQQFFDRYF